MGVYQRSQENLQTIIGTLKTVIAKVKTLLQVLHLGICMFFIIQGQVSNQDHHTSIRLMAKEEMPATKAYAKEIDINEPFELLPGTVKLHAETQQTPAVSNPPLSTMGPSNRISRWHCSDG